eukprot:6205097-Amphidinium_carterae.1
MKSADSIASCRAAWKNRSFSAQGMQTSFPGNARPSLEEGQWRTFLRQNHRPLPGRRKVTFLTESAEHSHGNRLLLMIFSPCLGNRTYR